MNTSSGCAPTNARPFTKMVGVPSTDEQIAQSATDVKGKTEMDALVEYLQSLGLALK